MSNFRQRPQWASKLGFILAAIGSAVGLGNIWRFPYIMGKYGGSVFLITYLVLILTLCSIPLICELSIGKYTRKENIRAYKQVNKNFIFFAYSNVIASIIIASFYFVIGGWLLKYVYLSISNNIVTDYSSYFSNFISSTTAPCILTTVFLVMCMFFIYRGVNKGIEFINKIMMPLFLLILIILCIFSLSLPNAIEGIKFIFMPDVSKISGEMLLAALGQALFTLSVGMGILIVYGSYMKKETSVIKSAYTIIVSDTFFAILSGIMIFPAVFSFGIAADSGAGLAFITLPNIFAQITNGHILSILFFVLLFFAAFTSSISIVEVPTAALMKNFKLSRKRATIYVAIIVFVLAIPVSLSMGKLSSFKIFGMNLFDFFDYLTSNIMLPIDTLALCIMMGWFVNLRKFDLFKNETLYKIFNFILKFILPIALLIVILFGTIFR